ncbi:MAG TPA: amino acid ABC transporter permease [Acidimicrobiales bacterium]|nr:amino acid ABC transporter permease [Acidimicrobiales bacterium]
MLEVVPVRHVGRWVAAFFVALGLAMLVHTLVFSKAQGGKSSRFGWAIVFQYFTTRQVLDGLLVTIELTILAMTIGIVLGMMIAIMRLSHNRLVSGTAWSYTWFFRGTPVYVQLLFWFNISALYHTVTIGLPFLPVTFLHLDLVAFFTPFHTAMVGLGLNEAAYMSEIARSGLISVDEGQIEAATSLGMTRAQTLRLVILPQAMRVIIPPTGNEVISMLKTTSLAIAVALTELLQSVTLIYSANYEIMPLLIVASLWYLIVTTVLSIGQYYVERHYAKGALRTPPPTPIQRLRQDMRGIAAKFGSGRSAVAKASS